MKDDTRLFAVQSFFSLLIKINKKSRQNVLDNPLCLAPFPKWSIKLDNTLINTVLLILFKDNAFHIADFVVTALLTAVQKPGVDVTFSEATVDAKVEDFSIGLDDDRSTSLINRLIGSTIHKFIFQID